MMTNWRIALVAAMVVISGCGSDDDGSTFDAPELGEIVDASVPSGLKSSSLFVGKQSKGLFSSTCSSANNAASGCGTASEFLSFLQAEVFQELSGGTVAATQYYRYWVDVIDAAMAETNTRLKENSASCLDKSAKDVDFSFNIGGEDVTVTMKLQCWEDQDAPGDATQNFAFGKADDTFYLVFRTSDNATTGGSGDRILLAKASGDGNQADIWFVGQSYQTSGGATELRGNAQRVMANKSTGEFVFNTVEDPDTAVGMLFSNFYGRTDGTNFYAEAAYGNGSAVTGVTGMTRSSAWCSAISAFSTAVSASTCESINASNMPSGFGLSAPMTNVTGLTKWQADDTAMAAYFAAIDAIKAIDYKALGVSEM